MSYFGACLPQTSFCCIMKNINIFKLSKHPHRPGELCRNVLLGKLAVTTETLHYWMKLDSPMISMIIVAQGQQYTVGEKFTVIPYTYTYRHGGTQRK